MVNWNSPELIARQQGDYLKLQHVLVGIYFWEFVVSLDFDWSFFSGKRKIRWPILFYFFDRYSLLFAMIGLLVLIDNTEPLSCTAISRFAQFTGNASVGFASMNLAIRTIAVWGQNMYIVALMIVLSTGHFTLIIWGCIIKSEWVDGVGCSLVSINPKLISAMFIYSMCFDFIVMSLSAYRLFNRRKASPIVHLLIHDGLIYFLVAFVANIISTTFLLLDLNPVMTNIANTPAATASTIVACRVVRRLFTYSEDTPAIYVSNAMGSWTRKFTGSVNPNSVLAFHRTRAETATVPTEHHTLHHIPTAPTVSTLVNDSKYRDPAELDDLERTPVDSLKFEKF